MCYTKCVIVFGILFQQSVSQAEAFLHVLAVDGVAIDTVVCQLGE